MPKKIFITGISGLLGSALGTSLSNFFNIAGNARNGTFNLNKIEIYTVSIEDHAGLKRVLSSYQPDVIIHAAAMTSVQDCDQHQHEAYRINVEASHTIADWCQKTQTRMIFTSTDLVFDGKKGHYTEKDSPCPLSRYGQTKLEAEKMVQSVLPQAVILRLSLLYGLSQTKHLCFFQQMINQVRTGKPVHLFSDQYRTPLWIEEACRIIKEIIEKDDLSGLYHLGGSERISRYDMAFRSAPFFQLDTSYLIPTSIDTMGSKTPIARDCSLISSRLEKDLSLQDRPSFNASIKHLAGLTTRA
ncbi:MAG: SDR family oxidoreductase [Chlamydiota bacterium]|nr:SDR family oxidoreductase [Chlamydiota bacterium]